jgi:RNA recognition motif-containing protein
MNIYVGNISRRATEQDLKDAFAAFGEVSSSSIIKDKFSGESRGFGFVEMPNKEEADKAIAGLNGKDLKGRPLTVNEARPRTDRPRTGGGGGGRGGFGGGRGPRTIFRRRRKNRHIGSLYIYRGNSVQALRVYMDNGVTPRPGLAAAGPEKSGIAVKIVLNVDREVSPWEAKRGQVLSSRCPSFVIPGEEPKVPSRTSSTCRLATFLSRR